MTQEQIKKHKEVIIWFCNNPEKGVWYQHNFTWRLTSTPSFLISSVLVQNDEYAKLRKALANGKTVLTNDGGIWNQTIHATSKFYNPPNFYRIKPDEPELEVGDWVTNGIHNIQFTQYHKDYGIDDSYKLWRPKPGDLCIFYSDCSDTSYIIAKYSYSTNSKHYSTLGHSTNLAPLEFAQTLKDK